MVEVIKDKCIGCGACAAACEEGFVIKVGVSVVKNANAGCIDAGIAACPVDAIKK